ncbi:MAG TPA: ferritin family protein [Pyrinomonadaceae bacterium]|nr:ferritin family protein [Pyrinomonadaceae bacterium]
MQSTSTMASSYSDNSEAIATANPDMLDTALYYSLFHEAEGVRWKMSDIPFDAIETEKASPALVGVMKELAAAELTTWTATNQFFEAFREDIDFTQWVTVWLYEETKHPQALMRWLKHFGESFDQKFFSEGRKTYPFMDSKMGTLTLNILSEIETATFYLSVSRNAQEPVLKLIAQNLAADEARHASSFYVYAKKRLNESENPRFERFEALKVLYFWLISNHNVKHPFALFANKIASKAEFDEVNRILGFKTEAMYARMRTMIGSLVGVPLENKEEVRQHFLQLQKENPRQIHS